MNKIIQASPAGGQKDNKVLRQKAKEVPLKDIGSAEIKKLLEKMAKTLRENNEGVALAAPQIGKSLRIFIVDRSVWEGKAPTTNQPESTTVVDSGSEKKPPIVFINPRITKTSKKKKTVSEGCLSVDGMYGIIERAEKATIEAYDENGKKFTRGTSGFLAQVIQHETDHLNGTLFIDNAKDIQKVIPQK